MVPLIVDVITTQFEGEREWSARSQAEPRLGWQNGLYNNLQLNKMYYNLNNISF